MAINRTGGVSHVELVVIKTAWRRRGETEVDGRCIKVRAERVPDSFLTVDLEAKGMGI